MTSSLPKTMAAVLLTGHGGYDQLQYREDVPVPSPAPGEVLIRVGAAGINNTDLNTRTGWYAKAADDAAPVESGAWTGEALRFPRIQGADVCGVIVALGEGVETSRLGRRVLVQPCLTSLRRDGQDIWLGSERDGGFAQYTTAPAADAFDIDSPLTDVELAAFPCAYGTAENLLTRAGVAKGETVLITGATGGVGSAAVQLAARRGVRALAVVSREKLEACHVLPAEQLIVREDGLASQVAKDSVDVVIDLVGGPDWPSLLTALKPGGRYAISGAIGGPLVQLDLRTLYLKDLTLMGCTAQSAEVFKALIGHIERGEVRPLVAATYALKDLARAQGDFAAKRHLGKLVVVPPA